MITTGIKDRSELPKRLEVLDKLRAPRYSSVQLISAVRQDEPNMDERYVEVMNQCRKWFQGEDQSHRELLLLCRGHDCANASSRKQGELPQVGAFLRR